MLKILGKFMFQLKKLTQFIPLMALLLSINVFAKEVGQLAYLHKEIAAAAELEMKNSGVPSLQIAIGLDNKIVYENAFGMSDIENQVQASTDTKYRTASVAKWFTATAAMKLVDDGLLNLDKPIQSYCTDFPEKKWSISSRQLLSHMAGIRGYIDFEEKLTSTTNKQETVQLELKQLREMVSLYRRYTDVIEPLELFKFDPLAFEPGSDWEYTSLGYRLLACVLQGAAGEDYRVLMDKLIFQTSGMTHTVADDAWSIIPHRATGYRLQRGKPLRRADMRDVSENLPAGGYLSTATDLVKFAQWYNGKAVSDDSKKRMTSTVAVERIDTDSPQSWRDAVPNQERYGYGVMLWSKYKAGMMGHTGRQAGAASIVILIPSEGLSIAVMTNTKGWNGYLSFVMTLVSIVDRVNLNQS